MLDKISCVSKFLTLERQFPYYIELNGCLKFFIPHRHNYVEISYIRSGSGKEIINGTVNTLLKGSLSIILPHQTHQLSSDRGRDLAIYNLCLSLDLVFSDETGCDLLRDILFSRERINRIRLQPSGADRAEGILKEMWEVDGKGDDWRRLRFHTLLISLLLLYYDNAGSPSAPAIRTGASRNRKMWEAAHYLYLHFTEEISLANLADRFSLSRPYLCALFKREVGQNISDFIHTLRIDHGAGLIARGELNLTQIAQECGYGSYSSFACQFKRLRGVSPREW